ncbi:MAG: hypothetical protein MH204_12495 [Fimbriimonadaceae bacterium]|nr:hypothetical protein [Fimbriimonadaceae bacterium]
MREIFVDIGATKSVLLAASTSGGKIAVDGFAVLEGGLESLTAARFAQGLDRLEKELGCSFGSVLAACSGPEVTTLRSQGIHNLFPTNRAVRPEDLLAANDHSRQVQGPRGSEQIGLFQGSYSLDGVSGLADPVGRRGSRLEVSALVAFAPSALIEQVSGTLPPALCLNDLIPGPLASGYGCTTDQMRADGVLVVDLGAESTGYARFAQGLPVASGSLPYGMNLVAKDVAQLLTTDLAEARRLVQEHGTASLAEVKDADVVTIHQLNAGSGRPLKRRALAEIIEARVVEIAQLLRRRLLNDFGSAVPGVPVVLTGGGARLGGVEAAFDTVFAGQKTSSRAPRIHGPNSRRLNDPVFSGAVGLAVWRFEYNVQGVEPVSTTKPWSSGVSALQNFFRRDGS